MSGTASSSLSAQTRARPRLLAVPLERLLPHPANANVMDEERLRKLAENIRRERDYPPLVVRPDPETEGCYQLLDGHQRCEVLRRLGRKDASCYVWPCDDQTALVLLATLNRLEGRDDPMKRAELLRELSELASPDELARLLPEDAGTISSSLELLDLNLEELLADLRREGQGGSGLRAITFAVGPEDEQTIEQAVQKVVAGLAGTNRRGRALAMIADAYLEGRSA